jgi:hypothetical protein
MSDITKCPGGGCPIKERCHRFTAKPSDYQSYFVEPPYNDLSCDMFWSNESQQIYLNIKDILSGNLK